MNKDQNPTLSLAARSPQELLAQMSRLYLLSRSIHAVAELGIANLIGDGPISAPDVARSAGVSSEYLGRCLRFLSAYGVFEETSPGWFRATALSEVMRDDHPKSMRPILRMVSGEWWDAVGRLPEIVRSGRSGIELGHGQGRTLFDVLKESPELQPLFDDGMSAISRMDDETLAGAYDFSGEGVVVDLAGGEGGFLQEILRRNPRRDGVLFEQPHVLAKAKVFDEYVRNGRARLCPGNLFEVLPAPADIYVIKGTLDGFADRDAIAILSNCASFMITSYKLLVIEQLIPPWNAPHLNKSKDMVMMTLLGGKQRTIDEWREMLSSIGFRSCRVLTTPTPYTVLEVTLSGDP
jgi:C-methyltransferase